MTYDVMALRGRTDQYRDWLRNFMIGDAYGAGFEFKKPDFVSANNDGRTYHRHGLDEGHAPGQTTDDTQMTLAVRDVLSMGPRWAPVDFADCFVYHHERKPACGYGSRMRVILPEAAAIRGPHPGQHILNSCRGFTTHDTNGAAMRAIPCGLSYGREAKCFSDVIHPAQTQARTTHHHPDSIDAAIVIALAAYNPCVSGWDDALRYVGWDPAWTWTPFDWKRNTEGKNTVRAALGLLVRHETLSELLIESVALGGDVDTLAALTLGIGSLAGKTDDLHPDLVANLIQPIGIE